MQKVTSILPNQYRLLHMSIAACDFSKLSLLEVYKAHRMYDIICPSETYLDSFVPYDDPKLNLSGYKLVRADNMRNSKRVDVVTYFKGTLAVRPVPITT